MVSPTLIKPKIADFTNAQHNHQNAAGGGTLDALAITSGLLTPARMQVVASWTPTGNLVTLTVNAAQVLTIGSLVVLMGDVTWPVTADAHQAIITGIPHIPTLQGGSFVGYHNESPEVLHAILLQTTPQLLLCGAGMAVLTNAQMSGARLVFTCVYF